MLFKVLNQTQRVSGCHKVRSSYGLLLQGYNHSRIPEFMLSLCPIKICILPPVHAEGKRETGTNAAEGHRSPELSNGQL